MVSNNATYDITIIGGGPAGMFAGFYAGLRNAKVQLIESLTELGGQASALYPEKTILDVAGYPMIKARDLVEQLEEQLKTVETDVKLNQTVNDIKKTTNGYQLITNQETTFTKAIIIATGVGAFNPRKLAVENSADFEGQHLFYSVKNLNRFKDQTILVAGGGDSAIDEALLLEQVAKKVFLLHRRDKFRAMEHSVDQLKASSIETVTPYLIKQLTKTDNGQVVVKAKKMKSEDFTELTVDKIVVNYGFIAQDDALNAWEVHPEINRGTINVRPNGQTNLENVFAIGDVSEYEGKEPLISTAFGEAPVAVNAIMQALYPDRRGPLHSTAMHKS
ncbi:NAD(P)/FAD-dependent oxidoreductase [Lentilactobacillus hilgardii]|uniref:NAD(P)/FAD-dependent oxidoreductase n=1 Tax=Lentilactobacillus hilgardii TaxID=1588 RepID=UPI0021C2E2E1|nr:NAD(P)/FAD-dependent oxidoreductase [Lentilactobacillus hilgardii]MCP9334162.1 NAD(P)/FAD-dependent oxidoreductase [Lentilactobacillus hilgardii]MCP9350778.1 NAD(P)/FAD-dependent oxidoreductase [Lentilactobacillus hilgardii]MCP9353659.1 NAD(P)/FAD-dependent oxidoreductase [Lentilactobacillus hilgardii]